MAKLNKGRTIHSLNAMFVVYYKLNNARQPCNSVIDTSYRLGSASLDCIANGFESAPPCHPGDEERGRR